MPFGFKQVPQGLRVLIGIQWRLSVARVRADPAGMNADNVQVRLVLEIVMHGHGQHIQGGLLRAVIQVEGPVALADAACLGGDVHHQPADRALLQQRQEGFQHPDRAHRAHVHRRGDQVQVKVRQLLHGIRGSRRGVVDDQVQVIRQLLRFRSRGVHGFRHRDVHGQDMQLLRIFLPQCLQGFRRAADGSKHGIPVLQVTPHHIESKGIRPARAGNQYCLCHLLFPPSLVSGKSIPNRSLPPLSIF